VIKYIDHNLLHASPNFNKQSLQCSAGWRLSTFYTPLEIDFNGSKKTILALNQVTNHSTNNVTGTTIATANISSSLSTFTSFLNAVHEYGWGKTRDGNYLGYYDNHYYIASHPLNSIGKTLRIGDIAVDPSIIALGTKVTLSTLPLPWGSKTYTASDTGVAIKGKLISVYIGEGKVTQESDAVKSLAKSNSTPANATTTNNNVKLCYFRY
jgi:3D (Asp-Asp-Asp) domain-containing protein